MWRDLTIGFALLLLCMAPYGKAISDERFTLEFERIKGQQTLDIRPKLSWRNNRLSGYFAPSFSASTRPVINSGNSLVPDLAFHSYKVKFGWQKGLTTTLYGKENGRLTQFALEFDLFALNTNRVKFDVSAQSKTKLNEQQTRIYWRPHLKWDFANEHSHLGIEYKLYAWPCRCPNGKVYVAKEVKLNWRYAWPMNTKLTVSLGFELTRVFSQNRNEQAVQLSIRYQ